MSVGVITFDALNRTEENKLKVLFIIVAHPRINNTSLKQKNSSELMFNYTYQLIKINLLNISLFT